MKIYTVCKSCQRKIKIRGSYPTRIDLTMDKGKEMELTCPFCKKKNVYAVDSISAEKDQRDVILLIFSFLLIGGVLWFLYPFAMKRIITLFILPIGIGIPVLLYGIIIQNETKKVKIFNSTRNKTIFFSNYSKKNQCK